MQKFTKKQKQYDVRIEHCINYLKALQVGSVEDVQVWIITLFYTYTMYSRIYKVGY